MTDVATGKSVIDAILALILFEGLALLAWRRLTQSGPSPSEILANLAAGGCIFLALRAAVSGSSPVVIGVCLAAALVAHVSDVAFRWRSAPPAAPTDVPGRDARVSRDEVSHG